MVVRRARKSSGIFCSRQTTGSLFKLCTAVTANALFSKLLLGNLPVFHKRLPQSLKPVHSGFALVAPRHVRMNKSAEVQAVSHKM